MSGRPSSSTGGCSGSSAVRTCRGTRYVRHRSGNDDRTLHADEQERVRVQAITYGGIITSITAPDRNGASADIVLGFDTIDGYVKDHPFFGAIIGRYGNRIGKGRFTLDGQTYDGEEGYPGTVAVRVTYELTDSNQLIVKYRATTDQATPINLTQHTYFNLAGANSGDILGQSLVLNADRFTPVDGTRLPTGEIANVEGTPFDFRQPTTIGARIKQPHPQMKHGQGYDHNWVLNRSGDGLQMAAMAMDPVSGRAFPSAVLQPGQEYKSSTVFTFGLSRTQ